MILTGELKEEYKNGINRIFKNNFTRLGLWGTYKNNNDGVLINREHWAPENRINTNQSCFNYLSGLYVQLNNNVENFNYNDTPKLIDFLDKNFDLFFTKNTTDVYYNNIHYKLSKSWNRSLVTTIGTIILLRHLSPNIKIEYSFETGEIEDFNGNDLKSFLNKIKTTFQIKSGEIFKRKNYVLITGANNGWDYDTDRYCYVQINNINIDILIFHNDKNILQKNSFGNGNEIPSNLITCHYEYLNNPFNNMKLPILLYTYLEQCYEKNIYPTIKKDSISSINEKNNIIFVGDLFNDDEIKNLINILEEKIEYEPIIN